MLPCEVDVGDDNARVTVYVPARASLSLSLLIAGLQYLRGVRVHTHAGPYLAKLSDGTGEMELWFVRVSVFNHTSRPVVINRIGVVGKRAVRDPAAWINEFPFALAQGETKTLELCVDDNQDQHDAPQKGEWFVARDSGGHWWPRRRRLQVWRAERDTPTW